MSQEPSVPTGNDSRAALRQQLLSQRRTLMQSAAGVKASSELSTQMLTVLQQIEPQCLGIYWALEGEFDPVPACLQSIFLQAVPLALPFATRASDAYGAQMHYRAWDRKAPQAFDECRIPTASGPRVEPDVVLVPCLGFTASGYRLGYGGGYFDRYLQAHQGVTAIGLAWASAQLSGEQWQPQAHDIALTLVLTPNGIAAAP
jgi:5,10-methenyltetrahydrofolate synthetase